MDKEHKKELLELQDKADKILRDYQSKGGNIEWGLMWMESLKDSILEKDFAKHNKAFIWFKNASYRGKEFNEVYNIVNEMTSMIYI